MPNAVSAEIAAYLKNSSMIRRMFEAGIELKKQYGADKVYDFSLGNPDLPPPVEVKEAIADILAHCEDDFAFGYMPNAGYNSTRAALAAKVSREQGTAVGPENLIVTCGAAGAINVFFRAVLSPGDEVIVPSPYFVEYGFYTANFGGRLVPVPSRKPDFRLDIDALAKAMNPKTRAVIINSPNNPTGVIYSEQELEALKCVIEEKSREFDRVIHLVSDEPYTALNYSGRPLPAIFGIFRNAVIVGSFSKSLSLAGERVGYLAVNPAMTDAAEVAAAATLTNRILGFVNAPVSGQRIVEHCINAAVDVGIYRRRRDAMAEVLSNAGIKFPMPEGAFYIFAESPIPDDGEFVKKLLAERILAVPGSGFGCPGCIRLAFCVDEKIIRNSAAGFVAAMDKIRR